MGRARRVPTLEVVRDVVLVSRPGAPRSAPCASPFRSKPWPVQTGERHNGVFACWGSLMGHDDFMGCGDPTGSGDVGCSSDHMGYADPA